MSENRWEPNAPGGVAKWGPVLCPLAVLLVLSAPCLVFLLPAAQDHIDEITQPLQALKFFASRGTAFHKYGPAPNFVLGPVYGATLACWRLNGSLGEPSDDYPYGLSDPVGQLGVLIFESRLLFLVLGLAAFAFLGARLWAVTRSGPAVAAALFFCVCGNYTVVTTIATARPDSAMVSFCAAALGVYLGIVANGLTPRRAASLSLFAVLAVSSKENAAYVFVPVYAGLAWDGLRSLRGPGAANFLRSAAAGLLAGLVGYALLNVVYAPAVWWQRMEYWLHGPGIAPEVWGDVTRSQQLVGLMVCLGNNLGPGGSVAAVAGLVAVLTLAPPHRLFCSLPFLGALLGAFQIKYGGDRFLTLTALCLTPAIACGLGALFERLHASPSLRRSAFAALALLSVVNLAFLVPLARMRLEGNTEFLIERYALANVPRDRKVAVFSPFGVAPGATRLEGLGFRTETRAYQEWARPGDPDVLPGVLFINVSVKDFIEDIARYPARGDLLRQSGFDYATWHRPESLGYALTDRIEVPAQLRQLGRWFPLHEETARHSTVLVYTRRGGAPTSRGE